MDRRPSAWTVALLLLVLAVSFVAPSAAAAPPKVRIGVSYWIGYAPFFLGEAKGFFKEEGADVEVVLLPSIADRRSAMAANRIQGFTTTVDTHIVSASAGIDVVQVLALDDSYGGDGVVALRQYDSLQSLVGKRVGLHTLGGASFFWFLNLLEDEGLHLDDFEVINMTAGDAGAAFMAGRLDAALTWEPWLSQAKASPRGHVIIDSSATPGVIADALGLRRDFVEAHPEAVAAIVRGWYRSLEYMKENPRDAHAIMARALDQTVEDFEATLPQVRFYGPEENAWFFGTASEPGPIYDLARRAVDIYVKYGVIENAIDPTPTIDGSFINR